MSERQAQPQIPAQQPEEDTYFSLMRRVGTKGLYQWVIVLLSVLLQLQYGIMVTSPAYLFMNPTFDCTAIDAELTEQQCQNYVCNYVAPSDLSTFPQQILMTSLSVQFGPYYCDSNYILGIFKGLPYLGICFGVLISVYLSDNKTRKGTVFLFNGITNLAYIILYFSPSIYVAQIGLFMGMFGSISIIKTSMTIVTEITEPVIRQRFIVMLGASASAGELLSGFFYPYIGHWRKAVLFMGLIPSILLTILLVKFLKDTPKFILKNSATPEEAAQEFNKIGRMNKVDQTMLYQSDQLAPRMQRERELDNIKHTVSALDLFRYQSLRMNAIFLILSVIVKNISFLSLNAVIERIGLDAQINSTVIYSSELMAIPLAIVITPLFRRKLLAIVPLIVAIVFCVAASFVKIPEQCKDQMPEVLCGPGLLQLVFIAIFRFAQSFNTSIIYIMLLELFPVSIRNIGIGVPTAFGGIGSFLSQTLFVSAFEKGVDIFLLNGAFYLLGIGIMLFVEESYGKPEQDYIVEVGSQLLNQGKRQTLSTEVKSEWK